MLLAKRRVNRHQSRERRERRAAKQRMPGGHRGVSTQRHHHGRVGGDEAAPGSLGARHAEKLRLAAFPGVVEMHILRHRALTERRREFSLLAVGLALRGRRLGILGSLAIAGDARAAHRARQTLHVHEVSQAHLAEHKEKSREGRGANVRRRVILRGERGGGERAHHVRGGTLGIGVQGVERGDGLLRGGVPRAARKRRRRREHLCQRGKRRRVGLERGRGDAVRF